MAQHDMNIANQSFPSFRTDLNNALSALNTMHSGTSRPSGAAVGTMWLDTTNSGSNSLEIKFFDGSDDISFATVDTSANTINFIDSATQSDLVNDSSPQLGADLDTNSFNIKIDDAHFIADENGNEQIIFQTTSSAVNQIDVTNAATGNAPSIQATGGDSNINLKVGSKGTGLIEVLGATNPGSIQLNCESNSHGIKLTSPAHSAGQSYELKFPTNNVTAGKVLKVDSISGSGTTAVGQLTFGEVTGGESWQAVKTSTFTASAGEGYFVNTTSGAITMNLPAGTLGDFITFIDYAGTFDSNTFTISANGSEKILGSTNDLTISVERAANTLVYTDGTQGWLLKAK